MSGLIDAVIADLEALRAGRLDKSAFAVWHGGGRLPNGSFVLGHLTYTDRFDQFWKALNEAGFSPDARLNYIDWRERFIGDPDDPETVIGMSAQDLRHQVVRMRRGERFCDGHWAALLDRGTLLAALLRARALG